MQDRITVIVEICMHTLLFRNRFPYQFKQIMDAIIETFHFARVSNSCRTNQQDTFFLNPDFKYIVKIICNEWGGKLV